jgi:uncharacterized protein
MVGKKRLFFSVLIALTLLGASAASLAAEPLVADLSGTFTPEQAASLESAARSLGQQYAMDIVIVTTDDTGGKDTQAFADDYFDEHGYGVGAERDGILFLIDFQNRLPCLSTSGSGIRYLTDARIESILDDIYYGGLQDQDFFAATQAFLQSTAAFLAQGIPPDQYSEPEKNNTLTASEGIIGALLSGGAGLGFFAGTRRSYRGTAPRGIFDYRSNSLVSLGVVSDNQINAYTTTRIIPRTPPPGSGSSFGGRSTTHTSSSGRTHGGGVGRRF